jgi:hypothetical protein
MSFFKKLQWQKIGILGIDEPSVNKLSNDQNERRDRKFNKLIVLQTSTLILNAVLN